MTSAKKGKSSKSRDTKVAVDAPAVEPVAVAAPVPELDMSSPQGGPARRNIDLERREDRFLIFIRDTQDVLDALGEFADIIEYEKTPVTHTLYCGDSIRGLPPGLSVKARTYSIDRQVGRWEVNSETLFNLLELKRTVAIKGPDSNGQASADFDFDFMAEERGYEEVFEVLDLAAQSFPTGSLKSKKRTSSMTLGEVIDLLSNPVPYHGKVPEDLYLFLLENVHPLDDFKWMPLNGTEYRRKHFKTKDPQYRDVFRATMDTRVTHYSFRRLGGGRFTGTPVGVEDFSRLEIKADYEKLHNTPLGERIAEIVLNFKAFRIPSKKYRSLTLRGQDIIEKYGFKTELPGNNLKAYFMASPIRYRDREHYVNLARYIATSGTFKLFPEQPMLIEVHENAVVGKDNKLFVRLTGNSIIYDRAPEIKKIQDLKIEKADRCPVAVIPIESRDELGLELFKNLKEKNNRYLRSKGFLVQHKKTKRVYKVALERIITGKRKSTEDVCIYYMGKEGAVTAFNDYERIEQEILALYRFLKKYPLFKSVF